MKEIRYYRSVYRPEQFWVVGDDHYEKGVISTYSISTRDSAIRTAKHLRAGGFWRIKAKKL